MATLRPAVKIDDSYIKKIIKYIPAEIVAAYMAIAGYLAYDSESGVPENYVAYFKFAVYTLFVFAFVWTYYAVKDNDFSNDGKKNKRAPFFHAIISVAATAVWVYALGNPLLKAWFCGLCDKIIIDCAFLSPEFGSIILVLFTIMVPLLERICFGKG